ncbi:hypothetical protein O5O45_10895 [Hahella aquimaris]|uniref:hypothetical protein n=1 Tax=Hahella sp. HNIBRBA332 TaxID=3015983 RepID=UPI00273C7D39|nr:hypothetical protein [Hahella sp. HNIBRBA332]WLQ16426.1 hypothetical protein O5O45_10895 [Hahella sp. HNIBRBA332]
MTNVENNVVLWESFHALFKSCFGFDYRSLEDIVAALESANIKIYWHSLSNWEDLEDLDILHEMLKLHVIDGEVFVITEASNDDNNGPFQLKAEELEAFVKNHLSQYGECFFNGDVAIVSLKNKSVWAFHHEGVFAYIDQF